VRNDGVGFDRAPHRAFTALQGFNAMSSNVTFGYMPRPSAINARGAPRLVRCVAGAALVLLLSSCSSVDWVKSRFVEPGAAPAEASPAAATAATPAAPQPAESPTYRRRLRDAPPSAKAAPPAPAAPAASAAPPPSAAAVAPPAAPPAAAVTAPVVVATAPAAPVALPPAVPVAPPAPAAQALTAPVPPRATTDMQPGHFAVQVAAFMTPASAEAQRSRVTTLMRAASMPEADSVRVLKLDNRYHVLVGDYAERAQAEALATQVRGTLQRDVVIFRR
jgi:hypothetical protein